MPSKELKTRRRQMSESVILCAQISQAPGLRFAILSSIGMDRCGESQNRKPGTRAF
ncbi:MAG TPA: hypothetical protein VFF31_33295 [Blastocatellia bacterium]|nr:hypothetical protein [Blastocatellia bacterium]